MTDPKDSRMRLEAYSSALHDLVGVLSSIRDMASVSVYRGEPLDAQWVLDAANGRFAEVNKRLDGVGRGNGSSEYWREAREVRTLLAVINEHASAAIQPILDAAEVVEDRFSDRFAGLDARREAARKVTEAWR